MKSIVKITNQRFLGRCRKNFKRTSPTPTFVSVNELKKCDSAVDIVPRAIKIAALKTFLAIRTQQFMKNVSITAGLLAAGLMFAAQANAREGHALVQTVSGKASMSVDGKKWIPLQVGALLKTGTTVKTSAEGRTDLFLGLNGSMLRLVGGTELTFSRLNIEESPIEPIAQTEMILKSGRAIGNVRKLPIGSSYVMKTPKGEANVTVSYTHLTLPTILLV